MSPIEASLLADITWRESELVNLKAAYGAESDATARGKSFRRSYLTMLYAHYEGFVKFAIETYLIEISRSGIPVGRLRPEIGELFLHREVGKLRSCPGGDVISEIFNFRCLLLNVVGPTYNKFETSNLWPSELIRVLGKVGIPDKFVAGHWIQLKSLVGRRNDIAHGSSVGVSDSALSDLEVAVWGVFIELTIAIVEACEARSYLN